MNKFTAFLAVAALGCASSAFALLPNEAVLHADIVIENNLQLTEYDHINFGSWSTGPTTCDITITAGDNGNAGGFGVNTDDSMPPVAGCAQNPVPAWHAGYFNVQGASGASYTVAIATSSITMSGGGLCSAAANDITVDTFTLAGVEPLASDPGFDWFGVGATAHLAAFQCEDSYTGDTGISVAYV